MDRIKAAVLFDCDERQREELEAAGKDMVEFVYVPEDMSRKERLPMLKQAQIIFGQPGLREDSDELGGYRYLHRTKRIPA